MLATLKSQFAQGLAAAISKVLDVDHDPIVEYPPKRELGDLASPAALHLARVAKRNPREIAQQLAEALELPEKTKGLIDRISVEGPGYLNVFFSRSRVAQELARNAGALDVGEAGTKPKVIIEHTNINPNKAAHIGHLRNAVLGDVLARCFRALDYPTEVQNYIDDTGVQVADVVVGFCDIRGETYDEIAAHPEPFDYLCWDLYSEVGAWYEADSERLAKRRETLHELESGEGERARIGRLVASRIVGRHLATMARLDIDYDLLTRESEILRLDFFARAFEKLESSGAIKLEHSGKNDGCWVMPLSESAEFQGLEDPDKVIVRSDGTITYVGKDIAYQLWKFGRLGLDFEYAPYSNQSGELWETTEAPPASEAPAFGNGQRVINVIDARQSYLQKIVRAGLEALGHEDAAEESIHFAYEMVSLSPQSARQLGFLEEGAEDKALDMSGRKGIGVKADDLLDQLIDKSREEIRERNRELAAEDLELLAEQIARAALRYFMVRATTTRVIAFDFDQALSFEGDSGPYLQYSLVRTKNILRRLEQEGLATRPTDKQIAGLQSKHFDDDLWDLMHTADQIGETVARACETLELSLIARAAVDLAQKFHSVYHKHPILHEEDEGLRAARLLAVLTFKQSLEQLLALLGVPVPERM